MKTILKYHALLWAALCLTAASVALLNSCEKNEAGNETPGKEAGATFSLRIEQSELSEAATRASGTGGERIQQLYYAVRDNNQGHYAYIDSSQVHLAEDLGNLRINRLAAGNYSIFFYASTQAGNIPKPHICKKSTYFLTFMLESPGKPINADYLYGKADFTVSRLDENLDVPVLLKRIVGRLEIDIEASEPVKKQITNIIFSNNLTYSGSIFPNHNSFKIDGQHFVYICGSSGSDMRYNILNYSIDPADPGFYSFPSTHTLSGEILIQLVQDGNTINSRHYFKNVEIKAGKISRIHVALE